MVCFSSHQVDYSNHLDVLPWPRRFRRFSPNEHVWNELGHWLWQCISAVSRGPVTTAGGRLAREEDTTAVQHCSTLNSHLHQGLRGCHTPLTWDHRCPIIHINFQHLQSHFIFPVLSVSICMVAWMCLVVHRKFLNCDLLFRFANSQGWPMAKAE